MNKFSKTLTCLSIAALVSQNCAAQTDQEIEKREAAVGFFLPTVTLLTTLRLECRQWLAKTDDDVDDVARKWWQRNRDDLDTSIWIIDETLRRYRATMTPEQALTAQRRMVQSFANDHLGVIRGTFQRQVPTPESCRRAVLRYKTPLLDVGNIGTTPGYEQFGEFGETLKRARADKSYRPPDEKFRSFEKQLAAASIPLVTLDAIEAAKERHHATAIVEGYQSLIARGDRNAAQTLGVLYLNGQYVPRDYSRALTWFFNAWAMGDPEGINALGVMARDGLGIERDDKLALTSFAVAKTMAAGQGAAFQRAASNYSRLSRQMSPEDLALARCIRWEAFDARWRKHAAAAADALPDVTNLPKGTPLQAAVFEATQNQPAECGD